MDDLISRQEVIEMLTEIETNNWFPTFAMLKQRVSDIPTAYDVDKVVEEIQQRMEYVKGATKYGNKNAEEMHNSYVNFI